MKIVSGRTFLLILLTGLMPACRSGSAASQVDLTPAGSARWIAVNVDDAAEVGLLEQQLGVVVARVVDGRAYIVDRPGIRERLVGAGYQPTEVDRQSVEERVVRVSRRGTEPALLETGVRLINREETYWVVRGSLSQLASLRRLGYQLSPLAAGEPRPREIRLTVRSRDDVARVAAFHVDIYSARQTDAGIIVYAGAFDGQIDLLRAAGYAVERVSTVGLR